MSSPERRLLNLKEAARYFNISQVTMRRLAWAHRVPCVRFGKRVMFDRPDLDKFIEQSKVS